jgi:RNA polymerase sigma factor (sigma-70 family)
MSPGIPTRLLATQSDERLLALVRQGHERAFEALVHRYRKPLLGYCRRLRLSDVRGEDIVQLALLKAWIAIREGAEVRDLKAWLYRVVHNTAVNALRDAAHDGEPLADPTQPSGSRSPYVDESQLDRRLQMREALAEVAALPPLQREVIVRTAVAGHSHEQVASDLGITNGAVRGLLYRARIALRTAITALTPPQLLGWLAGRADQGGPAPERLAELAGGGGAGVGAAGVGGLLLKGGVVAITAGTVITGAAVVRLAASSPHRDRHKLIAAAVAAPAAGTGDAAEAQPQARDRALSATSAHRGASARGAARHGGFRARTHAAAGGVSGGADLPGGGRTPRSTTRAIGETHSGAPAKEPVATSPAPSSSQGSSQPGAGSGQGSGQDGGSGQSGAGAGSGAPVGSAAGNGSGAGSSGGGSEGDSPSGGQSGSGSGAEPGTGSGTGSSKGSSGQSSSGESSGSGGSGGSSGSESSGDENSGSLVGAVVHEVGSVLEHLLH